MKAMHQITVHAMYSKLHSESIKDYAFLPWATGIIEARPAPCRFAGISTRAGAILAFFPCVAKVMQN
jgi:hypothetical protein